MNGIKQSNCKFYVNEAERTVVCVIPGTRHMVTNFIEEHFSFRDINLYDSINTWGHKWYKELELPSSFMGKAVCANEDEWNEELGRKIAFSRAKDKCYKSFFKRMNNFVQAVDRRLGDTIYTLNSFGSKLSDKKDALDEEIEKMLKKE